MCCSSSERAFGGSKGRRAAGQSTHGKRYLSSTPLALCCALISTQRRVWYKRQWSDQGKGEEQSEGREERAGECAHGPGAADAVTARILLPVTLTLCPSLSPPLPSDIFPFDPSECLLQVRFPLALISSPVTHSPSTSFSLLSSDRTPPTRTHTPQHPRFFSLASYLTL